MAPNLATVKNMNTKTRTRTKQLHGPWEAPKRGEPGGVDDIRRKGLSGAGVRWYLRYLHQGLEPDIAREKAEEHRKKQSDAEYIKSNLKKMRKSSIKVAVFPRAYPYIKLSDTEMNELEESFVDEIAKREFIHKLQFIAAHRRDGRLVIECITSESSAWIKKVAHKLSSWKGVEIAACLEEDLKKRYKILLTLPRSAGQNPKKSIALLNSQNASLNTNLWHVIESHDEEDSQILKLIIDEKSLNTIEKNRDVLSYKFGKVISTKLIDDVENKNAEAEEVDAADDEEQTECSEPPDDMHENE